MIRRCFIILLALALASYAGAQNHGAIKEDPSLIWAEGSADGTSSSDMAALNGLVRMLAATDILPLDPSVRMQVWQTYLPDIRRVSESVPASTGSVIRYIPWSGVNEVFESRWQKVRELCDYADKSLTQGDLPTARAYCDWAATYLSSLPPGEDALRGRLARLLGAVGEGDRTVIHLRNIESEINAIRAALSPTGTARKDDPQTMSRTGSQTAVSAPQSAAPSVQETDISVKEASDRHGFHGIAVGPAIPAGLVEHKKELTDILSQSSFKETPSSGLSDVTADWNFSLVATVESGADPAFGFMAMAGRGLFGGYISGRSNFIPSNFSYSCSSDGITEFGYLWATGESRYGRRAFTAGLTFSPFLPCHLFLGGGYGWTGLLWEDTDGRWAMVEDLSVRGAVAECGIACTFGHLILVAGISSIAFSEASALLGFGWSF